VIDLRLDLLPLVFLDRGNFDFKSDIGGVFDAPATNVFLVKWAYWLNF